MDKWRGKVAIVTGANSGIGAAIATALVREGVVVVGLDRQEDKIKSLASELTKAGVPGKLYPFKVNLRKEEEVLAAFAWVERELGGADILVNNAGVANITYIAEGKTEDWREMVDVNLIAVAICSREFLNSMDKRNIQTGHIINISSLAGHDPIPRLGVYAATKHGVKALGMVLRKELSEKGSTIKVTTVSPGPVSTAIYDGTVFSEVTRKMPILKSEDVAKVVVEALAASSVAQVCDVIINPIPSVLQTY